VTLAMLLVLRAAITSGVPADDPAVVALPSGSRTHCTGTLIAPRWVLTAAHCAVSDLPAEVRFTPEGALPVEAVHVHPRFEPATLARDVALLRLGEASALPPLRIRAYPGLLPGDLLRVVGWGDGEKLSGTARVTQVDDLEVRVEAAPSQPCRGDSGGPALATLEGGEVLMGVVSSGDPQCAAFARLVRVDGVTDDFVALHVPEALGGCTVAGRGDASPWAPLLLALSAAAARAPGARCARSRPRCDARRSGTRACRR